MGHKTKSKQFIRLDCKLLHFRLPQGVGNNCLCFNKRDAKSELFPLGMLRIFTFAYAQYFDVNLL